MEIKITITQRDVDEFNAAYFKAHPKAKKHLIETPQHPSLNQYVTACNMKSNSMKQNWKDFMIFILNKNNLQDIHIDSCEVTYVTYFKNKHKHDLDNISPKFIFDGLVAGGFIVGDDMTHIKKLTIMGGYDKENPRIELMFNVCSPENRKLQRRKGTWKK